MKGKRKSECRCECESFPRCRECENYLIGKYQPADDPGLEADGPWPDRALANAGTATLGRQHAIRHRCVLATFSGSSTWRRWLVLARLTSFSWSCRVLFKHAVVAAFGKGGTALPLTLAAIDGWFVGAHRKACIGLGFSQASRNRRASATVRRGA
jgi:hypothetical protein